MVIMRRLQTMMNVSTLRNMKRIPKTQLSKHYQI